MISWWILLVAVAAPPQAPAMSSDDVLAMSRTAVQEIEHAPRVQRAAVAAKWMEKFGTLTAADAPAQATARAEAFHMLVHSDEFAALFERARTLQPDDPVWEPLLQVLFEAGARSGDFTEIIPIATSVGRRTRGTQIRLSARLLAGNSLLRAGRSGEAREEFESVASLAPDSKAAAEARRQLRDLNELAPGTPAPAFAVRLDDGSVMSNASVRGKTALIYFWATWCGSCAEQLPILKELYDRYTPARLLLFNVSLDSDCGAAARKAGEHGVTWAGVCDGRGEKGDLARAFGVSGVPAAIVIDRSGSIAERSSGGAELRETVTEVVAERRAGRFAEEARRALDWRIADVFRALGVKEGSRVADIGAGEGFFAVRLASAVGRGGRVFAEDIDAKALSELEDRVRRAGLGNVQIVLGRKADPLLPPGVVDSVLLARTYHEVVQHRTMLARIRSALKPGGRVVIIDAAPTAPDRAKPRTWQVDHHRIARELVEQELADARFRILDAAEPFIEASGGDRLWMLVAGRDDDK